MQRSSMWYAYFRFYVDENTIRNGLDKYCTEWENMQSIGYNYKEYKCYVDNPGGLEHWVGDMGGYIADHRETGFMDGSPSDGIFDQTMLMGVQRFILTEIDVLNGLKDNTKLLFRKITAQDSGIAHKVSFTCGISQKINHPVAYTFESSQIEIISQTPSGIVDGSDVGSYEIMVDHDTNPLVGAFHSFVGAGSYDDIAKAFDVDDATYLSVKNPSGNNGVNTLILDTGSEFTSLFYDFQNNSTQCKSILSYSDDLVGWTTLKDTGATTTRFQESKREISGRYIKIVVSAMYTPFIADTRLYRFVCS